MRETMKISREMTLPHICIFSILAHILLVTGESADDQEFPPEFTECMEITKYTNFTYFKTNKMADKLSEEQQCFFKCLMEKEGYITPDGTVGMDALDKNPIFSILPRDDKDNAKTCFRGIGKVLECADIEKFRNCLGGLEY